MKNIYFLLSNKMFIEKTKLKDLEKEINSGRLVVVDFFADWCSPCKKLAHSLSKMAELHEINHPDDFKRVSFIKVDIELSEFDDLKAKYHISEIPRVIIFKNKKPIEDFSGNVPDKIFKALKNSL
jgi:thiol-disulfide isomerase/thioredoxin